ncbi:MAG: hypothetical protein KDB07_04025, partial [Planctomycetes bacterium]|nr:hypothetical protein [Planctomycetota bacterium]
IAELLQLVGEVDKEAAPTVNFLQPRFAPTPDLSATKQRENDMWQSWNDNGRQPQDLRPLLKSMRPLIQDALGTWRGRVKFVPDEALEAEFQGHAVKAIKSFDPSKGAQLGTWVRHNLRKGGRFAKTYQNVGRVVEKRTQVITDFNQAKAEMAEQLGRPPQDYELLPVLQKKRPDYSWSKDEIGRLNAELRADILSSAFESDMNKFEPSLDVEIQMYLDEELDENEKKVWEHIKNPGRTQGKTGLIAGRLGWTAPKVSRLRKAIEQKALDLQRTLR